MQQTHFTHVRHRDLQEHGRHPGPRPGHRALDLDNERDGGLKDCGRRSRRRWCLLVPQLALITISLCLAWVHPSMDAQSDAADQADQVDPGKQSQTLTVPAPAEAQAKLNGTPPAAPPAAPRPADVPARPGCIGDLIEGSMVYDGQVVTVEGEVIGDVMIRRREGWINISDGSGAIGVWGAPDIVGVVKVGGSYKMTGDRVRVTGTFRRADPAQGGELDVHASKIEVVEPGALRPGPPLAPRLPRTLGSLGAALILYLLWLRHQSRHCKGAS